MSDWPDVFQFISQGMPVPHWVLAIVGLLAFSLVFMVFDGVFCLFCVVRGIITAFCAVGGWLARKLKPKPKNPQKEFRF